jgi:hypothetical protein
MYRPLRGLEDGEDFDLNAVTDARIEVRARRFAVDPASTARAYARRAMSRRSSSST